MMNALRKILPPAVKKPVRAGIKLCKYTYRRQKIRLPVAANKNIKIIVGAAETYQKGWFSTNEQWLDITKETDWKNVFQGKPLLTHVVAEHVFEHLTPQQAADALQHIHRHLRPGGRVRIAVPDGYNPDEDYIRHVGIAGIGDDAADHKQLLNVDTLSNLLQESGFETVHVEGYNKDGQLVQNAYDISEGFIMRSRTNPSIAQDSPWSFPDSNTSLIVDGIKR